MAQKAAKRKAGRPPLAPTEDTRLTLRRERDRVAQRQSRLRKAFALSERDERIDKLSRTIEGLTSVFTDFNELVFRSNIVQADVESARRLKHLADRFLTVALDAAEDGQDERSRALPEPSGSPASTTATEPLFTTPHSPLPTRARPSDRPAREAPARPWSPRLTYGLVTNPDNCTSTGRGAHVIPTCLRSPRKTFAWRLLQATFTHGYPLWESARGAGPPTARVREIFRFTARHEPVRETAARVIKVVEYLFCIWGAPLTARTAGMPLDSPAFRTLEGHALAARERMLMLAMLIKRDLHLTGDDIALYLHAFELEKYLESAWGLDLSATSASLAPAFWGALQDPAAASPPSASAAEMGERMLRDDDDNWAPAAGDGMDDLFAASASGGLSVDVDDLTRRLIDTSFCFASGPRYYKPRVDEIVSQFLTENGLVTASPAVADTADPLSMELGMPLVTV